MWGTPHRLERIVYRIVLFLHVAGAAATFAGVGAWFFAAVLIRRSSRVEEVRSLASLYEMGGVLAVIGILVVAASGLDMALTVWSLRVGWIQVALVAFVLLAPIGPFVIGRRIELLIAEARQAGDGPLPPRLRARADDPVPKVGLLVIIGDLAGIVFLMTVKPSFGGSVLAILVFIGLGAVLAVPAVGRAVSVAVDTFARMEESNPLYRR
jgi:Predicted integral membrane protein (DUF2269)